MIFLSNREIRSLLKKYSVRPDKKRGQNFLKDRFIVGKIVEAAKISKDDSVLEIGGGLGVLSERLARVCQTLYIIEIEPGLVRALHELFAQQKKVTIIEGDALKIDLPKIDKIVANLPYSISSEITFRLLKELDFELAILMYQEEFANRLIATPGTRDYSRLTIDFQYYANAEKIMSVPSNAFYPEPAVDSTVVKITKRKEGIFAQNEDIFFKFIHGIYSYPKKQLRKALRFWLRRIDSNKIMSDLIIDNTEGITGEERLRNLSQESLIKIANTITRLKKEGRLSNL